MKAIFVAIVVLSCVVGVRADWVKPATQERSAYEFPGSIWLPDANRAPAPPDGYFRVRTWVSTTNGTEAFELWEDLPIPGKVKVGLVEVLTTLNSLEIPYGKRLVVPSYTNASGFAIFTSDSGVVLAERVHASPPVSDAVFMSNVLERINAVDIVRGNANKPIITNPEKIAIMWEFFKLQHNLDFDN